MKASIRSIALLAGAAAILASCVSDEGLLTPPGGVPTVGTPLLARYVSMGNSITAGFQSGGINDSTQRRAYPVILARMANVPFQYPSLGLGCPAPFTVPLGPTRTVNIPGGCALRASFQGLVNNVAVPAEQVTDLTNPASPGAANALSFFINGGLSEAQAMAAVKPTFVSLAAPNNPALDAARKGDTTVMPTVSAYMAAFTTAANAIKAVPTLKGAVLIGHVTVPLVAPIVQPGAFFFAAFTQNPNQFGKPVDVSCSPFTATGQPNPFGGNLVSFDAAGDTSVHSIRCTPDAKYVTTTSVAGAAGGAPELNVIVGRIVAINAQIRALAATNGWAYVDPDSVVALTPANDRKCQDLATATNLATFQLAVLNTCPGPTAPGYFGAMISLDAIHPSTAYHQALAVALANAINATYHTTISTNPVTTFTVVSR